MRKKGNPLDFNVAGDASQQVSIEAQQLSSTIVNQPVSFAVSAANDANVAGDVKCVITSTLLRSSLLILLCLLRSLVVSQIDVAK